MQVQETWVPSLGWEELEKGMATQSSTVVWRIPQTEEPGGLQCMELQKSQTGLKRLSTQEHIILIQNRQCWMLKCSFNLPCDFHGYYFWTVVLEKTLESPLDCKEIQPVNPKGKQS